MKLVNLALNAFYGYYFASLVTILAQFRIKCLNFATGNENVNWKGICNSCQDRSIEDNYGKDVKIFAKV